MNKTELVAIVADKVNLTKKVTEDTIDALVEAICEALSEGDKVVISGLGTFEVRERVERTGRNPRTGEEIVIPGQKSAAFKAGKLLKDCVK